MNDELNEGMVTINSMSTEVNANCQEDLPSHRKFMLDLCVLQKEMVFFFSKKDPCVYMYIGIYRSIYRLVYMCVCTEQLSVADDNVTDGVINAGLIVHNASVQQSLARLVLASRIGHTDGGNRTDNSITLIPIACSYIRVVIFAL